MAPPKPPPDPLIIAPTPKEAIIRDYHIANSMVHKLKQVHESHGLEGDEGAIVKTLKLVDLGHHMKEELPKMSDDCMQILALFSSIAKEDGLPPRSEAPTLIMTLFNKLINKEIPRRDATIVNVFDDALTTSLGDKSKEMVRAYRTKASYLYEVFLVYGWEGVIWTPEEVLDAWMSGEVTIDELVAALSNMPNALPELHARIIESSAMLWAGHTPETPATEDTTVEECLRTWVPTYPAHAYRPGGEKGRPLAHGMTSSAHAGSTGTSHTANDIDAASDDA